LSDKNGVKIPQNREKKSIVETSIDIYIIGFCIQVYKVYFSPCSSREHHMNVINIAKKYKHINYFYGPQNDLNRLLIVPGDCFLYIASLDLHKKYTLFVENNMQIIETASEAIKEKTHFRKVVCQ